MGKASSEAIEMSRDFKEKAQKKFGIEKMILFGSQATGEVREGSDIDLIVVSSRVKNKAAFMSRLSREWHLKQKKDYPVDFLPYTPEEFERLASKITLVKQAVEEGVEI
ncbi:MAG: nucleotidyltransferase domain-containing protein [Chloroflexi bacterium]|nr:nucleotidyltransferase domain-containing protein [Chloroflexota bacterium]